MHLAAGRTLNWIHFLDGRSLKCLRIHRETGVNHFSGRRTLDQDAVHTFLAGTRKPGACPTTCKEGSVTALTSRVLRDWFAERPLRTTLPPAARSTLPAMRQRKSGQPSNRSD